MTAPTTSNISNELDKILTDFRRIIQLERDAFYKGWDSDVTGVVKAHFRAKQALAAYIERESLKELKGIITRHQEIEASGGQPIALLIVANRIVEIEAALTGGSE